MSSYASEYKGRLLRAIETIPLDRVEQAIDWLKQARARDRAIFTCGNGGSASTGEGRELQSSEALPHPGAHR